MFRKIDIYPDKLESENFIIYKKLGSTMLKDKRTYETLCFDSSDIVNERYNRIEDKIFGDCLIVGLGFGIIGFNYKYKCDSITYIEIEQEIIDLVKPFLSDFEYICEDAFKFYTDKKYDYIYLDIFHFMVDDYIQKQKYLIDKYSKYLKEDGIIDYLKIRDIKIN